MMTAKWPKKNKGTLKGAGSRKGWAQNGRRAAPRRSTWGIAGWGDQHAPTAPKSSHPRDACRAARAAGEGRDRALCPPGAPVWLRDPNTISKTAVTFPAVCIFFLKRCVERCGFFLSPVRTGSAAIGSSAERERRRCPCHTLCDF